MPREYYSIPEAAALLGVSRIAVFKKVKSGKMSALRFGRNWAVPAGEVERARSSGLPSPVPKPLSPPAVDQGPSVSDKEMDSMGWD